MIAPAARNPASVLRYLLLRGFYPDPPSGWRCAWPLNDHRFDGNSLDRLVSSSRRFASIVLFGNGVGD